MNLYHYSAEPFTLDRRNYDQSETRYKPNGLWLSAEDNTENSRGWKQWCEDEDFRLDGLIHRTQIILKNADILLIDNVDLLDSFTSTYSRAHDSIDWQSIVACYDGILIAPYLWERRLSHHTFWYYPWDCASACVWNSRILEVVLMTEYYEILIPHGRGKTWIYGRSTREAAFEFAKDAKQKGHSPGIWHATTVRGRTGKTYVLPTEWDK